MNKTHKKKKKKSYIKFIILVILVIICIFLLKEKKSSISVSVLNFGDVMLDRGVRNIMEKYGRNPFEYVEQSRGVFNKFDVVIANLEGPIIETDRNNCQQKAYNFQFSKNTTSLLKSAGITMVNLANNHSYDCFSAGLQSTKKYLKDAGIDYIGDNNLESSYVIKEIDGKKVVFIGMDETVQMVPISSFYPLISKLDKENDLVVVNIHWGTEYSLVATEVQRNIAHHLIDSGADVIFGHHPHVIEPVEIYKNKAIFYSLGNFVFDQTDINTTEGLGAGVNFEESKTKFEIFPYHIETFEPHFLTGSDKTNFCKTYLKSLNYSGCTFELNN